MKWEITKRFHELGRNIAMSQCFIFVAYFGFNNKQIIFLQAVSKLFYKRVPDWIKMRTVYRSPTLRRSAVVCASLSTSVLFFPATKQIKYDLGCDLLYPITGFENDKKDGKGSCFNFIAGNGTHSRQDKEHLKFYTCLMPDDVPYKCKTVDVFHNNYKVIGFKFFDKYKNLVFEIGMTSSWKVAVVLAENEVIVGVVAKLQSESS